jgi:nitrate reductase alpha subunit
VLQTSADDLHPSTHPRRAAHEGYWEVASDGGMFTFGSAKSFGSMAGTPLNKPIVGVAAG